MKTLLFLGSCAGVGIGLTLMWWGLSGRSALPTWKSRFSLQEIWQKALITCVAALIGFLLTGWIVGAIAIAILSIFLPRMMAERATQKSEVLLIEAIASWTEMLRDLFEAGGGLEQAVNQSAKVAPSEIRPAVGRLRENMRLQGLIPGLRAFAADVHHPTADFIVSALTVTSLEGGTVGEVMSRLAASARADAAMRTSVQVGRVQARMTVLIVIGCLGVFSLSMILLNPDYLEPYNSVEGQLVLLLICIFLGFSVWIMERMSRIPFPERFLSRLTNTADDSAPSLSEPFSTPFPAPFPTPSPAPSPGSSASSMTSRPGSSPGLSSGSFTNTIPGGSTDLGDPEDTRDTRNTSHPGDTIPRSSPTPGRSQSATRQRKNPTQPANIPDLRAQARTRTGSRRFFGLFSKEKPTGSGTQAKEKR